MLRTNPSRMAAAISFFACLLAVLGAVRAEDSFWTTDFEAAKTKAKEQKKLMFVYFTGSDWCQWCKKLDKEVLDEDKFKTEAQKDYIFVELDYPHNKKLPLALETQNRLLQEHYRIKGWPTVIITDTDGNPVARTGYRPGGVENYLEHLADFNKAYAEIVEMKSTLATVQGLERAKLLDKIVEAYLKLNNEADETDSWSNEIIAIDSDNKAGLKAKYEIRNFMAEASKLRQQKKFEEAKSVLDKVIAYAGASSQQKQVAYVAQAEGCIMSKDFVGFVACAKKAIDESPEDPKVESLKKAIVAYGPLAEKQEKIAQLKAEAEKAEGLDRAKLLAQVVDLQESLAPNTMMAASIGGAGPVRIPLMLMGMPGSPVDSESIEKWSKEIVALDAENKAGLKPRYAYRAVIAEANTLIKQQRSAEAQKVIDKVFALPNLTDEQKQNALFLKANVYLFSRDIQGAMDFYKKALEATAEGPMAPVIKARIATLEKAIEREKAMADGADDTQDEAAPAKAQTGVKKDDSIPNKSVPDVKKDAQAPSKAQSDANKDEAGGKKESESKPIRTPRPKLAIS
jgi:thioredoxin-related protein